MYTQDALVGAAKAGGIDLAKLSSNMLIAQVAAMLTKAQTFTAVTIFFDSLHDEDYKRHVHTDVVEGKAKISNTVAEIAEGSRNYEEINEKYHALSQAIDTDSSYYTKGQKGLGGREG